MSDAQARRDAVVERARNVLVDAGAGTGKTTLIARRFVEMLAPGNAAHPPLLVERLAAVTFTRRAAGELRLCIREEILTRLADPAVSPGRKATLNEALGGLDTAAIGTVHAFADRLLRLRPAEARLSPDYQIVEDESALVAETWGVLMQAIESDALAAELAGSTASARAAEATQTVLDALRAGLKAESVDFDYGTRHGLSGLVEAFVLTRDLPPPDDAAARRRRRPTPDAAATPLDLPLLRGYLREVISLAEPVPASSAGGRWFRRLAERARALLTEDDPATLQATLAPLMRGPTRSGKPTTADFGKDKAAWEAWKAFDGDERKTPVRATALRDDLLAPLRASLATRLARLAPVVTELYERVKARHKAVDQIDLLLRLRELLAHNLAARGDYQRAFDHVFVDEFQDTDPLQAEILLFLCERAPVAASWREVALAPGRLTIVGDPKQSIYRFRRADVAMYDEVRGLVQRGAPLQVGLSANFRSQPALIDWLNACFPRVMGTPKDGALFDRATGEVFYQPLEAGRGAAPSTPVDVLDLQLADRAKVGESRAAEARALAHDLRWLVEQSGRTLTDAITGEVRALGYGDVAVLALSTWNLGLVFPELDSLGVPYSARGGRLFTSDALHRHFVLGLRALADRDDGVAEAALLRPPFFALDLADLVRERGAGAEEPAHPGARNARRAREAISELRRRRFERPPGDTARDLLETTAFGRAVALGPNGVQRLAWLREVCLALEQSAAAERLDYDAVTAKMRAWIDAPVQLDPPHPVGAGAVQLLTVHQAKGLEFPVVVLWDGRTPWSARDVEPAWRVDPSGRGWALKLDGLEWEEPAGLGLRAREQRYADAERRRVAYVAATRARELFVLADTNGDAVKQLGQALVLGSPAEHVTRLAFPQGSPAAWATIAVPEPRTPQPDDDAPALETRWAAAVAAAGAPRFVPVGVSTAAARLVEADDDAPPRKRRVSRYGSVFGEPVHLAIGAALRDPALTPTAAGARMARATGLDLHTTEAAEDMARALAALDAAGLRRPPGADLQLEYPVAGADGTLVSGYVDLLSSRDGELMVIDFKTDAPPDGDLAETHPGYVAQVEAYLRLLRDAGVPGLRWRGALLFTATGELRWTST